MAIRPSAKELLNDTWHLGHGDGFPFGIFGGIWIYKRQEKVKTHREDILYYIETNIHIYIYMDNMHVSQTNMDIQLLIDSEDILYNI